MRVSLTICDWFRNFKFKTGDDFALAAKRALFEPWAALDLARRKKNLTSGKATAKRAYEKAVSQEKSEADIAKLKALWDTKTSQFETIQAYGPESQPELCAWWYSVAAIEFLIVPFMEKGEKGLKSAIYVGSVVNGPPATTSNGKPTITVCELTECVAAQAEKNTDERKRKHQEDGTSRNIQLANGR